MLAFLASAPLLARCAPKRPFIGVRIGSVDADQDATIAEIYAIAAERQNIPVERHLRIGNASALLAALERREIDLYPGTVEARDGFSSAPANGDFSVAEKVVYERRDGITWLAPSPASDSGCLVASQYSAEEFWLIRMTRCAMLAPQLRLAATADFLSPGGTLDQLRRAYGGFDFKEIVKCDPEEQIYAVNRGDAEVANATTTDSNISETQMVVLGDDKHFWPQRHIAPIIRVATLSAYAQIGHALDRVSRALTIYALQDLNTRRARLDMTAGDAAEYFVDKHHFGRMQ